MSITSGSEPGAPGRRLHRERRLEPLRRLLQEDLEPRPLARALAVGALLGCLPLAWGTSLLAFGAALLLRLNPLAVQVGNYAAWPLQLVLAYPYLRLGTAWFGSMRPVAEKPGLLLTVVRANGAALGAWAVTAPLLLLLLLCACRRLVVTFGKAERL